MAIMVGVMFMITSFVQDWIVLFDRTDTIIKALIILIRLMLTSIRNFRLWRAASLFQV